MWVEPWTPDHWMRPGEVFTVATRADPENAPFNVVVHGQGISVWVNAGLDAEVFDAQGGLVPCAHQRPGSRTSPGWCARYLVASGTGE